jgi:hypothetical protein
MLHKVPQTHLSSRVHASAAADPSVVVAFDMCSSSQIMEQLGEKGDIQRLKSFLTAIKRYLVKEQDKVQFDIYKFTGDGWILLFPSSCNGDALSAFLHNLCDYFSEEFSRSIVPFLARPPAVTGLTFGIDKGPLDKMTMAGRPEFIGRAINVACRLQSAVRQKGGSPAYKALVSNAVFLEYFTTAKLHKVFHVERSLRNIDQGKPYRCRKLELFRRSSTH